MVSWHVVRKQQEVMKLDVVSDPCPRGWGRLKDYVNGVRIGPGSLFSHPWDGPTPSGLHPCVARSFEGHEMTVA